MINNIKFNSISYYKLKKKNKYVNKSNFFIKLKFNPSSIDYA